jgi:UDP-N-acetylmuramoyl-tripeptide--D-alanyl-D-alanine ligase
MATEIPGNHAHFTLAELTRATAAELRPGSSDDVIGVTTDTRTDVRGKLFVALSGEHFDGHAFVDQAVKGGARAVMVSRDVTVPAGVAVLNVKSPLDALGAVARLHRRRWGAALVAVAGSAGKTTTKSACAALLEAVAPGAVHAVAGNLNNRIGVPMVLLGLEPRHRVAVVEIGTNTPGEVAMLASIAEPDIAVLTVIGLEHSEGLGDLDAIEQEEGALLRALGPAALAVAGADDSRTRRQLALSPARRKLSYGSTPSDYRLLARRSRGLLGAELEIERPASPAEGRRAQLDVSLARGADRERVVIRIAQIGEAGALSALAALAVADAFSGANVAPELASRALADPSQTVPGRLRAAELAAGTVVLDDSYNSNPVSLKSSLVAARELASERSARLVLVLGEMRELGTASPSAHDEIGRELGATGAAALVAVSGDAERFVSFARQAGIDAVFAPDADAALPLVRERLRPGDVVLVKASRGVHTERIVKALIAPRGEAA